MDLFATFTIFDTADIPEHPLRADILQCSPPYEETPPVDSDSLVGYYSSFCTIA